MPPRVVFSNEISGQTKAPWEEETKWKKKKRSMESAHVICFPHSKCDSGCWQRLFICLLVEMLRIKMILLWSRLAMTDSFNIAIVTEHSAFMNRLRFLGLQFSAKNGTWDGEKRNKSGQPRETTLVLISRLSSAPVSVSKLGQFLYFFIFIYFLLAVIKHQTRSHLSEDRLILARSLRGHRVSWREMHGTRDLRQLVPLCPLSGISESTESGSGLSNLKVHPKRSTFSCNASPPESSTAFPNSITNWEVIIQHGNLLGISLLETPAL